MRLAVLHPASDLRDLVAGYCLADDPQGVYAGETILAAPQLGACICVQFGGDVVTDFRDMRPLVSFAGIQSRIRRYRPQAASLSLVIFLTPLGTIRFLPSNGSAVFDEGHEIGGMIGDGEMLRLRAAGSAAPTEETIAQAVDAWLRRLFDRRADRAEFLRLAKAVQQIGPGGRPVASVARKLDLSERQLERSFREHLGLSPKRYQQIHRVSRSLQAELTRRGDPLDGFSDQAHQIRNWQAYLGFTPGQMRRTGTSALGLMFQEQTGSRYPDWAHYL